MDFAGFQKLVPNIDLAKFATDAGLPQPTNMVAYGDTSITAGAKLVDSQPIAAWKKYLDLPHRLRQRDLPHQGV